MKEKGPKRFNFCLQKDEVQAVLRIVKGITTENCRLMDINEDSISPIEASYTAINNSGKLCRL
jgi:phage host-nuclease inhibitor protein Gam